MYFYEYNENKGSNCPLAPYPQGLAPVLNVWEAETAVSQSYTKC